MKRISKARICCLRPRDESSHDEESASKMEEKQQKTSKIEFESQENKRSEKKRFLCNRLAEMMPICG